MDWPHQTRQATLERTDTLENEMDEVHQMIKALSTDLKGEFISGLESVESKLETTQDSIKLIVKSLQPDGFGTSLAQTSGLCGDRRGPQCSGDATKRSYGRDISIFYTSCNTRRCRRAVVGVAY
jgi:uncharacterized protein (UPF0335 family)